MLPKDEPEAWGKISPQSAVIGGVTFEDSEGNAGFGFRVSGLGFRV